MAKTQDKLDTLTMEVKPLHHGGPAEDTGEGSNYTIFDLQLLINGVYLITPDVDDELVALDDSQLWLSQRYNRRSWVLTCTCGTPECAGFSEPVTTSRRGGRLKWTFPRSYFSWLKKRGIASGLPRPTTFVFDARQVFEQFRLAQNIVRQYEASSGEASAFSAGTRGQPYLRLDEQYARDEAWFLLRDKRRRYARHTGTRAGVCAGEPSIGRPGNVK